MKGIIPINKPKEWTSFDVVNKCKHLLKISRVGHLGTLDPMATGVLLVTVGKATKLFDIMQTKKKTYVAKFEFGYKTNTLDWTGDITQKTDKIPNIDEISKILPNFIGKIEQIPPKFSAKSVNGKRAYNLARSGVDFELKPKEVEIFDLQIINFEYNVLTLKIECGSGTYIRSLGSDFAENLNSLATMIDLERVAIDNFSLENCCEISNLTAENISNFIVPINQFLNFETIEFSIEQTKKILNGQTLETEVNDGIYMLNDKNDCIALVSVAKNSAKMSVFLG